MAEFPKTPVKDELHLLVSGRAEDQDKDALYIHQDAAIYGGRIQGGDTLTQTIRNQAYLLVSEGAITINGQAVNAGDGAEITNIDELSITATQDAKILLIDVPK